MVDYGEERSSYASSMADSLRSHRSWIARSAVAEEGQGLEVTIYQICLVACKHMVRCDCFWVSRADETAMPWPWARILCISDRYQHIRCVYTLDMGLDLGG
jgi:hypothetical protein